MGLTLPVLTDDARPTCFFRDNQVWKIPVSPTLLMYQSCVVYAATIESKKTMYLTRSLQARHCRMANLVISEKPTEDFLRTIVRHNKMNHYELSIGQIYSSPKGLYLC
jgi:hypothetical protein